MTVTDKGLVLRETKFGEASRILTVLTQHHGVISATAKGSLNPKSKLFSASGLYSYSEWVLREGRKTWFVDEAAPIEVFFGLRQQVESLYLAAYLAELAQIFSPTGEEAQHFLKLLLNSLYLLSRQKKPPELVKAVFEMRAMSEGGFWPDLLACQDCGTYEGGNFAFLAVDGSLLCANCAQNRELLCNIGPGALAALRHIVYSENDKVYGFTVSEEALAQLGGVAQQYILTHLHAVPRSLPPLEGILLREHEKL